MSTRVPNQSVVVFRQSLHRQCKTQSPCVFEQNPRSRPLTDLPNEVLIEIFSLLSFEDLVHNVRPVCKRFQALTTASNLWRNIIVKRTTPRKLIMQWLQYYGKHVRHFGTNGREDGNELIVQVSKYCRNLESISAINIWDLLRAKTLCGMVTRCKRLRRINLKHCRFGSCRFFKLWSKTKKTNFHRKPLEYIGPISTEQLRALLEPLSENGTTYTTTVGISMGKFCKIRPMFYSINDWHVLNQVRVDAEITSE